MPTTNKRVNMSVPDELYERLQAYKKKNGISSDAGACLQLVTRQLDALENTDKMLQMISRFTNDELRQITDIGLTQIKSVAEKNILEAGDNT